MNWLSGIFSPLHGKKLVFDTAFYSDIGNRAVQEDSVGVEKKEDSLCCIVCDGLGGHGMGDIASSIAVKTLSRQFQQTRTEELSSFLNSGFSIAQDAVMREQEGRHAREKMKTTAVALAADKSKAYIGYIGDSRIYIFFKNGKLKRSLDHSIPQMLVETHEIKESEIRNHPDRNILLRVMGVEWERPMFELMEPIKMTDCKAFLLCSDGFWELIEEKEMKEALDSARTAEDWLRKMIQIVRINGYEKNMDNNSAVAVMCNWQKEDSHAR